jgi:hypothetical protein
LVVLVTVLVWRENDEGLGEFGFSVLLGLAGVDFHHFFFITQ